MGAEKGNLNLTQVQSRDEKDIKRPRAIKKRLGQRGFSWRFLDGGDIVVVVVVLVLMLLCCCCCCCCCCLVVGCGCWRIVFCVFVFFLLWSSGEGPNEENSQLGREKGSW